MSDCDLPALTVSEPDFDLLAILEDLLSVFGISLPQMPTVPLPPPFCPLD